MFVNNNYSVKNNPFLYNQEKSGSFYNIDSFDYDVENSDSGNSEIRIDFIPEYRYDEYQVAVFNFMDLIGLLGG
jgi:hypothetical protein